MSEYTYDIDKYTIGVDENGEYKAYKEILQKYKGIIGDKDENNKQ